MNPKVTLAVSAALMSMSVHSAAQLGAAVTDTFDIDGPTLTAAKAISVNKGQSNRQLSERRTFIPEKGLENKKYTYIVQLEDPSVAIYDGGIAGLEATNPKASLEIGGTIKQAKVDMDSVAVKRYSSYLEARQKSVMSKAEAKMGGLDIVDTYQFAINGFSARLTPSEAESLSQVEGIRLVERERMYELHTDRGPELVGAPLVWNGEAVDSGVGTLGEGVVVGIIDSGINSDHPSFADIAGDGYDHTNPRGAGNYVGDCAGENPTIVCNDKLIGVRSYPSVTDVYADTEVFPPDLPRNGEDYDGHGSHVASTAAGNTLFDIPLHNPDVGVEESDGIPTSIIFPQISGVAPRANIIAYQVCLPGDRGDTYSGCTGAAILGAQEDAIIDGIDVANYSIGIAGPNPNLAWNNASEVGFLSMRNAGIFVATSAGNSGPDEGTTTKQAPWYTAVAASTHGRQISTPKELNGFTGGDTELAAITGSSNSGGISASIVYAGDFENPNDPDGDSAQCLQPFPENTFSGQIVVCDRGAIARVQKAINVADGGAGGYVLANLQGAATSVNSDFFVIPGIHIDADQGDALKAWLASGTDHMATITDTDASITFDEDATDRIIDFSSRGPNITASTLSPFVAAPGVDIYAAFADQDFGNDVSGPGPTDFNFLSGTSMASPHVAGAGALLTAIHPDWTPDMIRSALMMTATLNVVDDIDGTQADWFDMGSGRIQVAQAAQTGLVMDETAENYLAADPTNGGEPRALNIPSITDDNCLGVCTWTRTVTATKAGSWSASGVTISGDLEITVTPASFELAAGESQEVSVTVDAFSAPNEIYSFGYVSLQSESSPDLHMPVSVVANKGNLPDALDITAKRSQDSSLLTDVVAVEISEFTSSVFGLVKGTVVEGSAVQDTDNGNDITADIADGTFITTVDVPEGAQRIVALTSNSTSPDLDLFIIFDENGDGVPTENEVIGSSATASADEVVDLGLPAAGMYWLVVQNWQASAADATDTFDLTYAVVTGEASSNLEIDAPSAIPQFEPFEIRFTYDLGDASTGDMFFGAVEMGTSAAEAGNLGLFPVTVVRGEDDVNVVSAFDGRAEPGQVVEFAVAVDANFTPEERDYEVSLTLPEGVELVDGSTSALIDGRTLSWTLTQESLFGQAPMYRVTNNLSDDMCVSPFGEFFDLSTVGVGQDDSLDGNDVLGRYNVSVQFLGDAYDGFGVSDNGFITVGTEDGATPFVNQLFPDTELANGVIAPYWRNMEFDVANGKGVSVASNDVWAIVQYDNMNTRWVSGGNPILDAADFQVVMARTANTGGAPDITYVYRNVVHDFGDIIPVTIGYEDVNGETGVTGYYSSFDFDSSLQVNSVQTDVTDGFQVCMWLEDVASEPTLLTFSVQVDEDDTGGPIQLLAMSEVTNIPGAGVAASQVFEAVQVEGAPQVTIAGETTAALEVVELRELVLDGEVIEPNGDAVELLWKQVAGPAALIAGNGIAQARLIAPEVMEDTLIVLELTAVDSNGNSTTAVANVTVKNNLAPTLNISAPSTVPEGNPINVSVSANDPEGDTVSITINGVPGAAFSMTAPATNSDLPVTFTVVATDGLNTTEQTVTVTVTPVDGGNVGWIALLLLPAIWVRRRKVN